MTESLCSCCQLLGKPSARINFLIFTGLPDSLIYSRIKYILRHYSGTLSSADDVQFTNYESLMSVTTQLFTRQDQEVSPDIPVPDATHTCCHGFSVLPIDIADTSDSTEIDRFTKKVQDFLDSQNDAPLDEQDGNTKASSWIMLSGSPYLDPALLSVFQRLKAQSEPSFSFTFTILCFLVTEQRLFENWLFHNLSIQDYHNTTYPRYTERIRKFFPLLNSNKSMQEHTYLFEEHSRLTDDQIQNLLQDVFRRKGSKHQATNDRLRQSMEKLFSPRSRTVRDIRTVRNSLQRSYQENVAERLRLLFNDLKKPATTVATARRLVHLVLSEFERINHEELRAYKRILVVGFEPSDAKRSDTIVANLIRCAIMLLNNANDTSVPLIYAIVLTVCTLSSHFIFRHDLFNNTPEIYHLSLLLVSQRQYALTLIGLRLCTVILNGDQNEHKYAIAYLKHDPLATCKILDGIKWLLSPYISLRNLWKEEKEKGEDSEKDEEESPSRIAERCCFRHAGVLLERSYLRCMTTLLHASADHCANVTVDDVKVLADVIEVLSSRRLSCWTRGENRARLSLILIGDLCGILIPVLLYSSPSVHSALLDQEYLLSVVPVAITGLVKFGASSTNVIDTCVRFYTKFVQSKFQYEESTDDESENGSPELGESPENAPAKIASEPINDQPVALELNSDLIASYFKLYQDFQRSASLDESLARQEQLQSLFETEWKKMNVLQLKHDYDQLQTDHRSTMDELTLLREELQRTQSERDQLRKENVHMAEEIDRLKLISASPTGITAAFDQAETPASPTKANEGPQENIVDQLQNLRPCDITREQAEKCIQDLNHRRATFDDHDMRKSICGSLKHLGSDLYSSSVHFLHELIQNAEDNIYDPTTVPCLRVELDYTYILLSNNEQGLRARDVLAICSLAVSTKTVEQQHIGEKGVGFKSVFAASNQPMLLSHAWKFQFRVPGRDAMSYITPLWITEQDIPECIASQLSARERDTHLYLPLKLQSHTPATEQFLNEVAKAVDPCILLNMRQLKKLEINDRRQDTSIVIEKQLLAPTKLACESPVSFETFTFVDLSGSLLQLCTSTGLNTFRVYTCRIDVPSSIEQRRKSPSTSLMLAFPCESDYPLTSTVYTGLPVCDLGFNFMFNADFQLVTNRESVRENVPFNAYVRDHLAVLFVYLLLNDSDLRKDIDRYCPSSNIHQVKHSSWWLVMIDRINELITKHLSILFNIQSGKSLRLANADLLPLVSNDQLYNCAHIQVIDAGSSFLTSERLKSFQIKSVSIVDVLQCFPNRDDATNEYRQAFQSWTKQQGQPWWSHLFHHIAQAAAPDTFGTMLRKPLFILSHDERSRQYLSTTDGTNSLLFIHDDPLFRVWKRQLTLLRYKSPSERTALLKSNQVQLLTDERMIEIIRQDHLQLVLSSISLAADTKLIDEIWQDLLYLRSRLDKLDRSTPFLVPTGETSTLTPIQDATLGSLFGVDIRSLLPPPTPSVIRLPYHGRVQNQLIDNLQWEHFLLEMQCQRPCIKLPTKSSIADLPMLPSFTTFTDGRCAHLAESILLAQGESTRDCLQNFPIVAHYNHTEQISPVSGTFDRAIADDLTSLPIIELPSHCRSLASKLGVRTEYDLRTCVTILQLLSDQKNVNIDLYIQWLGHLQLYARQQRATLDKKSLLLSCQLYLPDQQAFSPLRDLLIISDNEKHRRGIALVAKHCQLHLITPTINNIYWPFKDLFSQLGCTCAMCVSHIHSTIYAASHDRSNFFALGDGGTIVTEAGAETFISLYEYLEDLLMNLVKESDPESELHRTIVNGKHPTAPCGSRDDLEWRFAFTCNALSKQLKQLTGLEGQRKSIGLLTIDRKLIAKRTDNIVYACFETKIIQNLSKSAGKRHFVSPVIVRTCPLVLAAFDIDYVERRGKLEWIHDNHNLEFRLNQLTNIFRRALDDAELEVISAKYASVFLLLCDADNIDPTDDSADREMSHTVMESNYPFWIFNKTVLLCTMLEKSDQSKAMITTSALTTLLHKRKYIPFEDAKSLARQHISECTAFRSDQISNIASTESNVYSYMDMVFPTDHQSVESMAISIGQNCTTEQDPEDNGSTAVAVDRVGIDQVYRERAQAEDHTARRGKTGKGSPNATIVDSIEQIRIGQNAEHFFFVYLQKLFGPVDVTPTQNWRSSARLVVYPECTRNVSDSAGYDFELQDTRQAFATGSRSNTKRCYFEVKGTSGSFNEEHTRFHITQNELDRCSEIANDGQAREREAYFLVIVQNCLDADKIAIGTIIKWSDNLSLVDGTVESYQCRILPQSPRRNNTAREQTRDVPYEQQQAQGGGGRNNNSAAYVYDDQTTYYQYNPNAQPYYPQQAGTGRGRGANPNNHYQQSNSRR